MATPAPFSVRLPMKAATTAWCWPGEHGVHRLVGAVMRLVSMVALGDEGRGERQVVRGRQRRDRGIDRQAAAPAPGLAVCRLDQERPGALKHVAARPLGDARHRLVGQRTVHADGAPLLGAEEDGVDRQRPVDDLRRRPPRLPEACDDVNGAGRAVRRLGPANRLAVASRHEEQALPDRRGPEVARPQLAPVDLVAEAPQLGAPGLEGLPGALRAGAALCIERPPLPEFLDVLQEDHARADLLRPAHDHPGQVADALLARLAALGLGMVLAVRRGPQEPDATAGAGRDRVHLPDVVVEVAGARVVGPVHRQGLAVVIDGDVRVPAERQADALRCAAAAGEAVYDQLVWMDVESEHWDPRVSRMVPPIPDSYRGFPATPSTQPTKRSA